MANKRYDQFTAGSYDAAKIFLIADPDTGALVKIPLSDIPTIYTQDGSIAANRTIDLDGNAVVFQQGGVPMLSISAPETLIQAFNNLLGPEIRAFVAAQVNTAEANTTIKASFNSDAKAAFTIYTADVSASSITHTADTHTFNAGGQNNLTVSVGATQIRGFDSTGAGNIAYVYAQGQVTEAGFKMAGDFNDGEKEVKIEGRAMAGSATITHTADSSIINGDFLLADLAGGGLTGASIDNTGKIVRS